MVLPIHDSFIVRAGYAQWLWGDMKRVFRELIDKDVTIAAARDVSYVDLLGRQEVKLDLNSIEKLLKGKRVLITGSGGSIGSELVKQCLSFEPAEII